jgi:hypothetical protein
MENQVKNAIYTGYIADVAAKLNMSEKETWNIYFDSGLNFIDTLKLRIRRKRTFDLQFRYMLDKPGFGKLSPIFIFNEIQKSPEFWHWWASQLYFACRDGNGVYNKTSLLYAVQFTDITIPGFILNKIFYGKQKHGAGKATEASPAKQNGEFNNTPARTTATA